MKNAMKKIMSLVLVAMILVSALPFAASAAGCTKQYGCTEAVGMHLEDCPEIPCNPAGPCHHGGWDHQPGCAEACDGTTGCYQYSIGHTDPQYHQAGCLAISKASESISNGVECTNSYDCKHVGNNHVAGCPMIPCSNDASCDHGGWNHLETCPYACKNSSSCHAWYHLDTCPVANEEDDDTTGGTPGNSTNNGVGSSEEGYHKLSGTVTLRIQLKGTSTYKDVAIKDGIAADGKVTMEEVKSVVRYYYNAIDGDKGILVDGIYIDDSVYSLWMSYAHDDKYNTVLGLYEAASMNNDVRLTVVIDNAKVPTSSNSNADKSNPKTGDMIMAPVAVMTVSASLLAVAFFLNKKRAF